MRKTKTIVIAIKVFIVLLLVIFDFSLIFAQEKECKIGEPCLEGVTAAPMQNAPADFIDENKLLQQGEEEDLEKFRKYEKYYRFGSVQIDLKFNSKDFQRDIIRTGEEVNITADLKNESVVPIYGGQLYIQLLKEEADLKNSIKNGDHLVDQFLAVDDIAIDPGSVTNVNFSWRAPKFLVRGNYKFAAFFTVAKKYNISGLTFVENVFASTLPFYVDSIEESGIFINRNEIKLNGKTQSLRSATPFVSEGEDLRYEIPIVNNTDRLARVKVSYDLYKWDGLTEGNKIETRSEIINIPAGKTQTVFYEKKDFETSVSFLMIKAENLSNNQKSMLKLRWETSQAKPFVRINYAGISKFPLLKGDDFEIFANYHTASSFMDPIESKIEVSLYDNNGWLIEQLVKEDNEVLPQILSTSKETKAKQDYNWLKMVARVYNSDGEIVDEGIVIYDSTKLSTDSLSIKILNTLRNSNKVKMIIIFSLVLAFILILVLIMIFIKRINRNLILIIFVSLLVLLSGSRCFAGSYCCFKFLNHCLLWCTDEWPRNNSSNPSITKKWQIARFNALRIFTEMTVTYNISTRRLDGEKFTGGNINLNVGDKIEFKVIKSGEHFTNGGDYDTPPLCWGNWDPVGDLYSYETRRKMNETCDFMYASHGWNENTWVNFFTQVVAGNPQLSVSSNGILDNCVQRTESMNDIKHPRAVSPISTLTCEVVKEGESQLNFTIGAFNFQEQAYFKSSTGKEGYLPPLHQYDKKMYYDEKVNDYLTIPSYTKTWNLTVTSPSDPPTPPTCKDCLYNLKRNEEGVFNIGGSTDPNGDLIRYEVDWDSDGLDYISSPLGASDGNYFYSFHKGWSIVGSKNFRARAIDIHGQASEWVSFSVEIFEIPIDGQCKTPPNNQYFCFPEIPPSSPPEALCDVFDSSNPPVLSGSGPWNWVCSGQNGGNDSYCQAFEAYKIDGACGSWKGCSSLSGSYCERGTRVDFHEGPYESTWKCEGACGGKTVSCSAKGSRACGWIETAP